MLYARVSIIRSHPLQFTCAVMKGRMSVVNMQGPDIAGVVHHNMQQALLSVVSEERPAARLMDGPAQDTKQVVQLEVPPAESPKETDTPPASPEVVPSPTTNPKAAPEEEKEQVTVVAATVVEEATVVQNKVDEKESPKSNGDKEGVGSKEEGEESARKEDDKEVARPVVQKPAGVVIPVQAEVEV